VSFRIYLYKQIPQAFEQRQAWQVKNFCF